MQASRLREYTLAELLQQDDGPAHPRPAQVDLAGAQQVLARLSGMTGPAADVNAVQPPLSAGECASDISGGTSQIDATCIDCGAPLEPGQTYRCVACLAVASDAQRLVALIRAGEATLDDYRAEIEAAPPDDPHVAHDRRVLEAAMRLTRGAGIVTPSYRVLGKPYERASATGEGA